ncbi:MAG TPA: glycogen/starch synthase, partial [Planctomycetota bacterium]|nr:glycogen/starch synthase [Planctomycetota bacterium]
MSFVAPECDPLAKVGGLGDVVGSLPRALRRLGHDAEVILPRYGSIPAEWLARAREEEPVVVDAPPLPSRASVHHLVVRDVPVRLLGEPQLFEREPLPYGDYPDNPARFAFFSMAALALLARNDPPDAIHVHDWATGFLPVYRGLRFRGHPIARAGVVFSIHNI